MFATFTFKPHPEWLCFSIVTAERTVSFAAQSDEDLATWVCGLAGLMGQSLPLGHLLWRRLEMHMRDELHNQGFTGVVTRLGEGLARQQAPPPPHTTDAPLPAHACASPPPPSHHLPPAGAHGHGEPSGRARSENSRRLDPRHSERSE